MDRFEELREKILPMLLPCGVRSVVLFGSVARGDESPESDIDILVEFKEPIGLFALARLRRELGEQLGRKVDLLTRGFIGRYIRPSVEAEKVVLYEE